MRRIRADLARLDNYISRDRRIRELLQVFALSLLAGVSFGSLAGTLRMPVIAAFVCGGVVMFLLAWMHSSRRVRARSLQLRAAVGSNTMAKVLHVRSSAYAAFEEHEDTGTVYAFQTAPGELFVLNGHRYHETGAFPCLEFDLVEVPGALLLVRPRSPKVPPQVVYSEDDTPAVAAVPDRSTVAGTVDDALQALRGSVTA